MKKIKHFKTILKFLLLFMSAMNVYAQGTLTQFTSADGLLDNWIYSIAVDSNDVVWVGSENGVSWYDGNYWEKYTKMLHDPIRSIVIDSNGDVWAGSVASGLLRYNGDTWTTYTEADEQRLNIISLAIGKDDVVWVGTSGLLSYDGETWMKYIIDEEVPNIIVTSIATDSEGDVWITTWGHGVSHFDGELRTTFTTNDGLVHDGEVIGSIAIDSKGDVWIGTWGHGVSRYSDGIWRTFTTDDGLVDNHIHTIAIDSNDVVWIGTKYGVSKYDGETWHSLNMIEGLSDKFITSIAFDSEGIVWFGSLKDGVFRFDPKAVSVELSNFSPAEFKITGNFPNPFNTGTTIQFKIPREGMVNLEVYNIMGQQIRTLLSDGKTTAMHSIFWDGKDENGYAVSSGTYFARLIIDSHVTSHKMTLIK